MTRVREALASRVDRTSLRQVAREVGMSPTGVRNIIDGADSYPRTRKKLNRWYVRERTREGAAVDPEAAAAAIALLLQDLPRSARPDARAALIELLRSLHTTRADHTPDWIDVIART